MTQAKNLSPQEFQKLIEDAWSEACDLRRICYLLMENLNDTLNPCRGRDDGSGIVLVFQRDGIDVTQWLSEDAYSRASKLELALERFAFEGGA